MGCMGRVSYSRIDDSIEQDKRLIVIQARLDGNCVQAFTEVCDREDRLIVEKGRVAVRWSLER